MNSSLNGLQVPIRTLAGWHALNASMFELAHEYKDHGMVAYSRLQERELEMEQQWGLIAPSSTRALSARGISTKFRCHHRRRRLDLRAQGIDRRSPVRKTPH